MIGHRGMKKRFLTALLFWGGGIGLYSLINYAQGTVIEMSFLVGWTAASVAYGFLHPSTKKI